MCKKSKCPGDPFVQMEGNSLPPASKMEEASCGSLDFGDSMQTHDPNSAKKILSKFEMPGTFTMSMNRATEADEFPGFQFKELEKSDKQHHQHTHHSRNCMCDDKKHDTIKDDTDTPSSKGKKGFAWRRTKWTNPMVKLLITAMSYTGDDHGAEGGGRRNFTIMQKKGKWKAISKVMGERDYHVSPQQCQYKFNGLNKRYKRLVNILGSGTACDVMANPALLDSMNHLSNKMKDDVKNILNSKHLFFEEMCSYHNNNRVNLPEDYELEYSLYIALTSKEEHHPQKDASEDLDDDQSVHYIYKEKHEEKYGIKVDINKAFLDGTNLASKTVEIKKRAMQVEVKNLELKRQRIMRDEVKMNRDMEIKRLALESRLLMIENKCLKLELKHKELELEAKLKEEANHP